MLSMKTTIDIPDPLFKRTKIRAIEEGVSFKQIVIDSLSRELERSTTDVSPTKPKWADRKLRPTFAKLRDKGTYRVAPGSHDITSLIAEDRDAR